jgi:hypothetical protein
MRVSWKMSCLSASKQLRFCARLIHALVWGQVGPWTVLSWFRHYLLLGAYSLAHFLSRPLRGLLKGYRAQRLFDAWEWGSGSDCSCPGARG